MLAALAGLIVAWGTLEATYRVGQRLGDTRRREREAELRAAQAETEQYARALAVEREYFGRDRERAARQLEEAQYLQLRNMVKPG